MNLGHWKTEINIPETPYGFIYEITNTITNKMYIGKKQMITVKKMPPLKGKKNKRHKIIDTDWRDYCGSSTELLEDIKLVGKDKFIFKILQFCSCKWELSYYEAKLQFEKGVLVSENYYNGIINCRIGKQPKKLL